MLQSIQWTVQPGDKPFLDARVTVTQEGASYITDASKATNTLCDRRMGPTDIHESCWTCGYSSERCVGHFGVIELQCLVLPKHWDAAVQRASKLVCVPCKVLKKDHKCPHPESTATTGDSIDSLYAALRAIDPWPYGKTHPADCFIRYLPVLPTMARPYIRLGAADYKPDPITRSYASVIKHNNALRELLDVALDENGNTLTQLPRDKIQPLTTVRTRPRNAIPYNIACQIETLTCNVRTSVEAVFTGSKLPGHPKEGIMTRFGSKTGQLRQNLMGNRAFYTARAVITPDPYLAIEEVGLPKSMADVLTVPEGICAANIKSLNILMDNGDVHSIERNGVRHSVTYLPEEFKLRYGDVVHRRIRNGDVVLFNRQPTLHRGSVMAHIVRLLPYDTIRMNPSACRPYNADFDGDEMNIHVPQTIHARAEAEELMLVPKHIVTPQCSQAIILPTFDALLGLHMLTKPGVMVPRAMAMQMAMAAGLDYFDHHLSGVDLVSALLPPEFTMDAPSIAVHQGRITRGTPLTKGGCAALVKALVHMHSPELAAEFVSRVQPLVHVWMVEQGASVSLSDVLLPPGFFSSSALPPAPDADDNVHIAYLDRLRNEAGEHALRILPSPSTFRDMVACGSKGSNVNITQISAMLGQQISGGQRIRPLATTGRCLPHFEVGSTNPTSRGFVTSGYARGLRASEYYPHSVCGREGIADTTNNTAKAGYGSRRLVKSLEDVVVARDGSVRMAGNLVIQPVYGEDGVCCEKYLAPFPVPPDSHESSPLAAERAALQSARARFTCPTCELPILLRLYPNRKRPTKAMMDIGWAQQVFERTQSFVHVVNRLGMEAVGACATLVFASTHVWEAGWTLERLDEELNRLAYKTESAIQSAGEAVGVIAAQAISEVITQMTLNTFHSTGLSNAITHGLPRLEELIDAKHEKTPTLRIKCSLDTLNTKIRGITIADILRVQRVQYASEKFERPFWEFIHEWAHQKEDKDVRACHCIVLELDVDKMDKFGVSLYTVGERVSAACNAVHWTCTDEYNHEYILAPEVRVYVHTEAAEARRAARTAMNLQLSGLSVCTSTTTSDEQQHTILCHSGGTLILAEAFCVSGVDHRATQTTDVHSVMQTLGIEAARATLLRELQTLVRGCAPVNVKHAQLIVDVMCVYGEVLGVHSTGLVRRGASTFGRASYERVTNSIVSGALRHAVDSTTSTSFSIATGSLVHIGSGCNTELVLDESVLPPDDEEGSVPVAEPPPPLSKEDFDATTAFGDVVDTAYDPEATGYNPAMMDVSKFLKPARLHNFQGYR